jgi:hypothetical protein
MERPVNRKNDDFGQLLYKNTSDTYPQLPYFCNSGEPSEAKVPNEDGRGTTPGRSSGPKRENTNGPSSSRHGKRAPPGTGIIGNFRAGGKQFFGPGENNKILVKPLDGEPGSMFAE